MSFDKILPEIPAFRPDGARRNAHPRAPASTAKPKRLAPFLRPRCLAKRPFTAPLFERRCQAQNRRKIGAESARQTNTAAALHRPHLPRNASRRLRPFNGVIRNARASVGVPVSLRYEALNAAYGRKTGEDTEERPQAVRSAKERKKR